MHYKSTDKEINKIHGTTAGLYNAASYGPQGKGVIHYYYNSTGVIDPEKTRWDNQRYDFATRAANHGLYSGPGSITDRNGNYDFSFQPTDWADAIAKRHDMDYAKATASGNDLGYIEDTRTYQAGVDMIGRLKDLKQDIANPFKKISVDGIETPFRTSVSGEMQVALEGQITVISALASYKKWKIDNGYTGKTDTFDKLKSTYSDHDSINAAIISILSNNRK